MMRHLIVNLESPLMAFGGETIDNLGVIRWFPAASMLTGLFANALGWLRTERQRHQRLQDRLIFAARIDREPSGGVRMTDYQTVRIYEDDRGWTTRGVPEGRQKSPSYSPEKSSGRRALTWQRYRDYFADMRVSVALRLEPDAETPTLDDLADALQEPKRPLFIGRKPCLPAASLFRDFKEGGTALAALLATTVDEAGSEQDAIKLLWPKSEELHGITATHTYMVTDQRNWVSGLHGGGRQVCEGTEKRGRFGKPDEEAPRERSETQ